jgi:cytochrome c oxidase subunit IV
MMVKFIYVAGYFMHLKYDAKVFSRMMYSGLFLALGLYTFAVAVMLFDSATAL